LGNRFCPRDCGQQPNDHRGQTQLPAEIHTRIVQD
jgi:hypothetical protein